MKNIFILALFALSLNSFFTGCGSKKDNETVDDKKTDTVVSKPPVIEKGVKFVCRDLMVPDTVGSPLFEVLLSVDGVLAKIDSVNQCSEIRQAA